MQTSEETLDRASGSCRDSAWLLVEMLRQPGLAARFVSGYLIQLEARREAARRPDRAARRTSPISTRGPRSTCQAPAGSASIPRRACFAGEGHIPLAATPSPESAAPVSGLVSPSQVEFHHEMSVTRIHEDPRVTKPYTDAQWRDILALGDRVDQRARGRRRAPDHGRRAHVRVDRRHGRRRVEHGGDGPGQAPARPERSCSAHARRRFAPGGLLHFGQGKWYPGESLPRWAFTCYWRTDGVPLWQEHGARRRSRSRLRLRRRPRRRPFAEALAERLSVEPRARDRRLRGPARLRPQGAPAPDQRRSRATTRSTIRRSASACAACSAAGWARRPASCCRWRACLARTGPPGSRACGCCAPGTSSWCRATRRSASACRWRACPAGPILRGVSDRIR